MNTHQIQEILNFLILGITAFYTLVMLVDFIYGLVRLWHQVTVNIEDHTTSNLADSSSTQSTDTNDINNLLDVENNHANHSTNSKADRNSPVKIADNNSHSSPGITYLHPELELNNSITVDIDKIDLRTARKIASAIKKSVKPKSDLIIKQKVNGKSVPLAWLQAQIKNRLEIAPEIVQPIIQEFAPTALDNSQQDIQHYQVGQQSQHKFQVG
jgi:hypothetical protein